MLALILIIPFLLVSTAWLLGQYRARAFDRPGTLPPEVTPADREDGPPALKAA